VEYLRNTGLTMGRGAIAGREPGTSPTTLNREFNVTVAFVVVLCITQILKPAAAP
jgi:hypothetical protein